MILKKHDNISEKGVVFSGDIVNTLDYTDDTTLLVLDNDVVTTTARVMVISQGSKEV